MLIENKTYDEERALYGRAGVELRGCTFDGPRDGESALKESSDVTAIDCDFRLRYPLWHVDGALIENCRMNEGCRAALWYDKDVTIRGSVLGGIKALRECERSVLEDCEIDSLEFGWMCRGLQIRGCSIASEYPFLNSRDIEIEGLSLKGKYSFQYATNVVIRNSELDTKDAFWHSRGVAVYDSIVKGEYLGWYAEDLKLVRCKIIGTQPLCYAKGVVLEDCTMEGCDLSFERTEVNATVSGAIDSVKNPLSGSITANSIGQVIMEPEHVASSATIVTSAG